MITQKRLKQLVEYDYTTGVFTRKVSRGGNIKGSTCGSKRSDGYLQIILDGRCYKAHRLAFIYVTGEEPQGAVDHINHLRTDNAWSNLRDVTTSVNNRNRSMCTRNTSGYVGVSWCGRIKRWRAKYRAGGKSVYVGCYTDRHEAGKAVKEAREANGYHPNHGENK